MGLIQRPVKQFGSRTFTDDFNAAPLNPTPPPTRLYEIQTVEFDGDADTIYALVNGNIDNDNIKPGAGIVYSKLDLTDQIVNADIAAGAAIDGAKLADVTVPTGKLVPGAAVRGEVTMAAPGSMGGISSETDIVVLPALTTRGGMVLVICTVGISYDATPVAGVVTLRVYRGATVIATVEYTVQGPTGGGAAVFPVPAPTVTDQPVAGTYVYKLTGEASVGALETGPIAGALIALELA